MSEASTLPSSKNTSTPNPTRFYHSLLANSLENLAVTEKTKKPEGPLESLISGKTRNLKATAKALLDEIALRERLDSHLLKNIDHEIRNLRSQLLHLQSMKTHYSLDTFLQVTSTKREMENHVAELEQGAQRASGSTSLRRQD